MAEHTPILTNQGLNSIHKVDAYDQYGQKQAINIAGEEPLTIKIDGEELVTLMTLGAHPELLVLGYLRNQTLFHSLDEIKAVSVDWDRELAEVETTKGTGVPQTRKQNLLNHTLDKLRHHPLPPIELKQSDIYTLIRQVKQHNHTYRSAGSVHGCGLCKDGEILSFIEDVGRHSAMDTISGKMWMENISGHDKIFYTTGRLTSEIVMKSALMGIPVLISRNGTTHMGFDLAQQLGVTLISRAKSRHFIALNDRDMVFDGL